MIIRRQVTIGRGSQRDAQGLMLSVTHNVVGNRG